MAGQTIRLAMPVSSSIVMKTTPLALPGRWRIRTSPAIARRRSDRQDGEIGGGDETLAGELGAQKGERVAFQGQPDGRVILDDMLAQRHFRQQRRRASFALLGIRRSPASSEKPLLPLPPWGERVFARVQFCGGEQRQRRLAERLQRPQRRGGGRALIERAQRVGVGEAFERARGRGRCAATDARHRG